jgi:alpha-tubulin suppressor-like RCC1 family protein
MALGRALRAGTGVFVLLVMSAGALAACAGLVGVEDVRLRRDSGTADVFEEEDDGSFDEGGPGEAGPLPVANVLEVALGLQHSCARKPDLSVRCWGDDSRGQIGSGTATDGGIRATPQAVSGVSDAIRIASGQNHTCIVRSSGKVSCWGDNQDGQLGNGQTNARSPSPVDVGGGITDAKAIACGASFSCALRAGGTVACWGNGLGGQLGNGSKQLQPSPVAVSNLTDAIAISAGESHACAVKSDGKLVCWGDGVNGQLGNGDQLERTLPTAVPSLDGIALVAAGSRSTCAAKKTGAVFCWGANEIGQLGSGAANPTPNPSPTVVTGLDAIALWAGSNHACAVKRGGAVACWGAGFQGQIGDGQPRATAATPTPTPTAVSGVTNAIGVGTGGNHSCAPTAAGTILCWGENAHGELGTGAAGVAQLSPESVVGYP